MTTALAGSGDKRCTASVTRVQFWTNAFFRTNFAFFDFFQIQKAKLRPSPRDQAVARTTFAVTPSVRFGKLSNFGKLGLTAR